MSSEILYLLAFVIALVLSVIATPICRFVAIKLNVLDNPITEVKTHKISTPYLGGVAVAFACISSLFVIRLISNFQSGTLKSLRGIIYGALLLMLLGVIDDCKYKGLNYKPKLVIQLLAAVIVVFGYDIRINFLSYYWLSCLVSIIWIVGVTNALNIIDIMDGLSSGITVIAASAFLFISLPTEMIYVNFCAVALAGAVLGFMPYNLSKSKKLFLGDTGSLFMGFVLACLAMGTSYMGININEIGLFAPLLILAVPIYETCLVSWFRLRKGKSPLMGSKDHYALRLEKMGWNRKKILVITYITCILLAVCAFLLTKLSTTYSMLLFLFVIACLWAASVKLSQVKVD